jgi:hypothetical protein
MPVAWIGRSAIVDITFAPQVASGRAPGG